jgi:hypothetical protein
MEPARFQCRVFCSNSRVEIEEDPRDPRTEAAHPHKRNFGNKSRFQSKLCWDLAQTSSIVGLQDLDVGEDDLQITAADYLPDDILAVPAYADLGFLVAVPAAAGTYSFKTDSQSVYPIIIGDGFQFDFRQHPQLGMLGAFSRYGKRIGSIETPSTDQFIRALRILGVKLKLALRFFLSMQRPRKILMPQHVTVVESRPRKKLKNNHSTYSSQVSPLEYFRL